MAFWVLNVPETHPLIDSIYMFIYFDGQIPICIS
jgi:hypothetical protein